MSNVIQLRVDGEPAKAELSEPERRLVSRFGVDQAQLHAAIKPLFLLMYDHGIGSVSIARDGAKAVITVDGKSM
jgi:hypothetical protein